MNKNMNTNKEYTLDYMEVAIPGVHAYTTLGDIVPCIYAWYACPYYTGGCTGTLGLYDTMIQCPVHAPC